MIRDPKSWVSVLSGYENSWRQDAISNDAIQPSAQNNDTFANVSQIFSGPWSKSWPGVVDAAGTTSA
jgi:hypothetical protein